MHLYVDTSLKFINEHKTRNNINQTNHVQRGLGGIESSIII